MYSLLRFSRRWRHPRSKFQRVYGRYDVGSLHFTLLYVITSPSFSFCQAWHSIRSRLSRILLLSLLRTIHHPAEGIRQWYVKICLFPGILRRSYSMPSLRSMRRAFLPSLLLVLRGTFLAIYFIWQSSLSILPQSWLCNGCAVSATRMLVMDRYNLRPDKWDNRIIVSWLQQVKESNQLIMMFNVAV